MPVSEFDIIKRYFDRPEFKTKQDVFLLGIGDDAALIKPDAKQKLAISIDTLNAGIHFPLETSAEDIAYKALAVNLSDMAAMGATPRWFTLALSLPEPDNDWLARFASSLFDMAQQYQVTLVGGDTTRGLLSVTIQIAGELEQEKALLRAGAQVGDLIYVSGTLGDAALGLALLNDKSFNVNKAQYLLSRLHRPTPRVEIGKAINTIAHACIDISDGLFADLGHILAASEVGANVYIEKLPHSTEALNLLAQYHEYQEQFMRGGDDYELCFCVAKENQEKLKKLSLNFDCQISCIGEITRSNELYCLDEKGHPVSLNQQGFDHFVKS